MATPKDKQNALTNMNVPKSASADVEMQKQILRELEARVSNLHKQNRSLYAHTPTKDMVASLDAINTQEHKADNVFLGIAKDAYKKLSFLEGAIKNKSLSEERITEQLKHIEKSVNHLHEITYAMDKGKKKTKEAPAQVATNRPK